MNFRDEQALYRIFRKPTRVQTSKRRTTRPTVLLLRWPIFLAAACTFVGQSASAQSLTCNPGEVETLFGVTSTVATYTVPAGASSVRIIAAGAKGGGDNGGVGAIVGGQFAVTPGQSFSVIVGQDPSPTGTAGMGGGGGSFVGSPDFVYNSAVSTNLYIAAGGGGGGTSAAGGAAGVPGQNGQAGTSGFNPGAGGLASGAGVAGGGGGATSGSDAGTAVGASCGGAGAGGDGGSVSSSIAKSAIHGGAGAIGSVGLSPGGFGGGGCAVTAGSGTGGGGGGGFAGGGGGGAFGASGGGGSSFIRSNGTGTFSSASQAGDGFVRFCASITPIQPVAAPTTSISTLLLLFGALVLVALMRLARERVANR